MIPQNECSAREMVTSSLHCEHLASFRIAAYSKFAEWVHNIWILRPLELTQKSWVIQHIRVGNMNKA
jgi:hypothetical protein